jgi:ubiquinone/menaquinone biosynthesis C-methylase UbiE
MDSTANEFDKKAKEWDVSPEHVHRAEVLADAINKAIPFDTSFTAMEYGCGTGLLSFLLKERFSKIALIDNSSGMLEVLRNKIKHDNVKNMDVFNVDIMESTIGLPQPFSVIYSSMVLHHIEDIDKILKIWYVLLNTPGYLCIADLDSDNGLFHGNGFKGHGGFDRKTLKEKMENAGFVNVTFQTVLEIQKKANDGISRSFPVFLMTARKL